MACCGPKCSKAFVIFYNILFWFSGCAFVVLGVSLLYFPMYGYLFTMLTADMLPPVILQYIAFGIIGLGGLILFIGFFGCCGAIQDSKCMLGTYVFFLILIFLLEAAAALVGLYGWFYFPPQIRRMVQDKQINNFGVKDPINLANPEPNKDFTDALDYVQYEFECCGIEGRSDWDHSNWRNRSNAQMSTPSNYGTYGKYGQKQVLSVPRTCCTTDKTQWQEPDEPWRDEHLKLKSEEMCQGQAEQDYGRYTYMDGCWKKVMDWYYKQHLCVTPTAGGLALLQIIGVVFSICLIRNIGEEA